MRPVLFHLPEWLPWIGDQPIPSYGVMMALGALLGCATFALLVRASGGEGGKAFEVLLETVLVAILGSKLIGLFFQDPSGDVSTWERLVKTGGVWYVGFLTGWAWLLFRSRLLRLPRWALIDCAACAVAVGHAFGRLGCFLAGCCFGGSCHLPWAVTFTSEIAHSRAGTPLDVPLHPVQLYEMIGELILAGFLIWWLLRKKRFDGQAGLLYGVLYGLLRFSLEFLREDHRGGLGAFSTSQWIALAIITFAVSALIHGARHGSLELRRS